MTDRKMLENTLRDKDLRVTPQRLAILEYLDDNTDHPTAEDVYNAVRTYHPSMSLNTVYKTLEVFEDADLVWKFSVGQKQKFHYDSNTQIHPHIVCAKCGRVDDLSDEAEELRRGTEDTLTSEGYEVWRVEVNVIGLCEDCQ